MPHQANGAYVKWNIVCISSPLPPPGLCPPEKCVPCFTFVVLESYYLCHPSWDSLVGTSFFVDILMHLFSPETDNLLCDFQFQLYVPVCHY